MTVEHLDTVTETFTRVTGIQIVHSQTIILIVLNMAD